MLKRFGAVFLVLAMLLTVLPSAFAEDEDLNENVEENLNDGPEENLNDNTDENVNGEEEEGFSYTGGAVGYDPETDTTIIYIGELDSSGLPYPASVEFKPAKTMYAYADNGLPVNVRSTPEITKTNKAGEIPYGGEVRVAGIASNPDWYIIEFSRSSTGYAFIMARFVVSTRPTPRPARKATAAPSGKNATPAPTAAPTPAPTPDTVARKEAEMEKQMKSYKAFSMPMIGTVRATRSSGWINFREGPGVASKSICTLSDGTQLKILGETDGWYYGILLSTGSTGYIAKSYIKDMYPAPAEAETQDAEGKTQLGKLTVHGDFTIQCAIPEGYQIQYINTLGSRIIGSITSSDPEKPIMEMTIAYDEMVADIERMNDMDPNTLAVLEASFTEMNIVDITYRETAYGTKLMVVKEIGPDEDFVDILTVYKGYSIEFLMRPNPAASNRELTEEQIQMCIDFLSEVDFVEAK
ncbi:MAG: SH3 domain-containing protein [Clostridia bacterium]|nr:SH3 domain-containing protein [Clostridia bacterium]